MKKAFTLAETLIVMGIIGVVAALTLPNLNSSTGEKEKVAKVKKIYSNLQDAFGRAEAVYGPFDEWFINDTTNLQYSKRAAERITEFMKLSKNCTNNTTAGCMTTGNAKPINSTYAFSIVNSNSYTYILADGTSICFSGSQYGTSIYIDIDGPTKGSFTLGKDVFSFSIHKINDYKLSTLGMSDTNSSILQNCIGEGDISHTCTAWVLKNDNMDYIKADKTGKCPNGTMLSETNLSCK